MYAGGSKLCPDSSREINVEGSDCREEVQKAIGDGGDTSNRVVDIGSKTYQQNTSPWRKN